MTITVSLEDLSGVEGTRLGASDWTYVTQSMINQFADATGDHQWIHTDPERAKDGPFGGPIAPRLFDPVAADPAVEQGGFKVPVGPVGPVGAGCR